MTRYGVQYFSLGIGNYRGMISQSIRTPPTLLNSTRLMFVAQGNGQPQIVIKVWEELPLILASCPL